MKEHGYIAVEVLLIVLLASAMVSLGGMYAVSDRLLIAAVNRTTASCLAQKELVCLKSRVVDGIVSMPEYGQQQLLNGALFDIKAELVPEEDDYCRIVVTVFWDEQGTAKKIVLHTAVVGNEI